MAEQDGGRRGGFWTTLPGILTGAAALITALVGVATFVVTHTGGHSPGAGTRAATTTPSTTSAAAGTASSAGASGPAGGVTAHVLLRPGEWLSVDTGLVGGSDVDWSGDQLNFYAERNVVEDTPGGRAGCERLLPAHAPGEAWLVAGQLTRPNAVCVMTKSGTVAELRISPPDIHNRLAIDETAWR